MMLQKRLAGKLLNCSPQRVKLDFTKLDEIKAAITKVDVRRLISQGLITKETMYGGSKVRARARQVQRRKGPAGARTDRKDTWVSQIRAQRDLIKRLRDNKKITQETYTDLYAKSKGGFFRSTRHIKVYSEEQNLFLK
jgi:large subunit ribosomal protein L19e